MTTSIYLTVTAEPPGFHEAAQDESYVSVHLAFDGDKADVAKLLKNPDWKLNIYQYDSVSKNAVKLTSITTKEIVSAPGLADELPVWLEQRKCFDPVTEEQGDLVNAEKPGVRGTLLASIGWTAPVSQTAQLTRILKLTGTSPYPTKDLLILPTDTDPVAVTNYANDQAKLSLTVAGIAADVITNLVPWTFGTDATTPVKLPTKLSEAQDPAGFPVPVCPEGFLFSVRAEDACRFLQTFEPIAKSLFWCFPDLLEVRTKLAEAKVPPKDLGDLGCAVALDPLWISLTYPGASGPDGALLSGAVLAPLVAIVEQKITLEQKENKKSEADKVIQALLDWLRKEVKKFSLNTAQTEFLGALYGPIKDAKDIDSAIKALRELLASLQSENGLEEVLGRMVVKLATIAAASGSAEVKKYADWLTEYGHLLNTKFNALEAVRYDCGHQFTHWLTTEPPGDGSRAALLKIVLDSDPYSQRLTAPAPPAPPPPAPAPTAISWADKFVKGTIPVANLLPNPFAQAFKDAWTSAVHRALDDSINSSPVRFVPDRSPQPLPLAIATTSNSEKLSDFTHLFNGIAVLLRTADTDPWAHANLVSLYPFDKDSSSESPTAKQYLSKWAPGLDAIKPFLPVAVDGRREMFVQYHGIPLGSPAYGATGAPQIEIPDILATDRPFYIHKDATFEKKFEKPPRLKYGGEYQACAFALSKTGSLPKKLQGDKPWLPKLDVGDPLPATPTDFVARFFYQRRTALGATTYGPRPGKPYRVGTQYDNIFPLALDFPRVVVSTGKQGVDSLDLYRRTDGFGQLEVSTKDHNVMRLLTAHRFISSSNNHKDSAVTIEVHDAADLLFDSAAKPAGSIEIKDARLKEFFEKGAKVEIVAIDGTASAAEEGLFSIKLDRAIKADHLIWLRLKLTSKDNAATWSFQRPESPIDDAPGAHSSARPPVLLVADGKTWDATFTSPSECDCALSRITWQDWERWVNNKSLEINGIKQTEVGGGVDLQKIAGAFLRASLMRGLEPSGQLSRLLDLLPDPAVCGFLVELVPVDKLNYVSEKTDPTWPAAQFLPAPNWMKSEIKSLPDEPTTEAGFASYVGKLRAYLEKIDEVFRAACTVSSGPTPTLSATKGANEKPQITVTVPPSFVARLSVRPVAKTALFGPKAAITENLKQLAIGTCSDDKAKASFVFPGAEVIVEGMLNPEWKTPDDKEKYTAAYHKIVANHLALQTDNHSRTHRILQKDPAVDKPLVAGREAEPWARLFAHVDIHSQRWRFSGRPIYQWIAPRDCALRIDGPSAKKVLKSDTVLEMDRVKYKKPIDDFEDQLFFERDDLDCQVTRARLLGSGTELIQFTWEYPSATYYRHGFSLVSRYVGGLMADRGDPVWLPAAAPPWSKSCAVLADSHRVEIARPQVRCLVPISTEAAPSTQNGKGHFAVEPSFPKQTPLAPTPPLVCILEERPFAFGGLADRILPEIVTGVGYGFEEQIVEVQPIDLGKETSRDGRIDSRSWKYDRLGKTLDPSHTFLVEAEGPIGLHFDRPTVPAPAWSNCQYLLKPTTIDGKNLPEESFLGIRMRRILEPDWVIAPPVSTPSTEAGSPIVVPIESGWHATFDVSLLTDKGVTLVSLKPGDVKLLTYEVQGDYRVLMLNRELLGKNYKEGFVALCAIPVKSPLSELRLLHTCQADARYTLTVLARVGTDADVSNLELGRTDVPQILASVDWTTESAPELQGKTLELSLATGKGKIVPLTSSTATAREWGRTAKNSNWVHAFVGAKCQPVALQEIHVRRQSDKKKLSFSNKDGEAIWPIASLADSRQPLYVQRHLVGLFTQRSGGQGRQFDLFYAAQMLNGKTPAVGVLPAIPLKLEIHELETPSSIVVANRAEMKQFAKAAIDLRSIGGEFAKDPSLHYRMHVRFANSAASLSSVNGLEIVLSTDKAGGTAVKVGCGKGTRAVDIFASNGEKVQYRLHHADGSVDDKLTDAVGPKFDLVDVSTLFVELTTAGGTGEVWADVSLLHSKLKFSNPDQFNFDWLFSTEDSPTLATRVAPATLSKLTEAQARLISASPPLVIPTK